MPSDRDIGAIAIGLERFGKRTAARDSKEPAKGVPRIPRATGVHALGAAEGRAAGVEVTGEGSHVDPDGNLVRFGSPPRSPVTS